ncbi:AAA family ATPase [Mycobacterium sp. KBS0706]|uniref:ATP-binding protein n=1 Tax=Mycobacterium sp. KBS0706 TaxID=2578109 RepID=UPI00110F7DC7|nr:AAA family ATPase [Mycobacterium sp. KBS0706]TSD87093.1 AAA family ATPase [Mycobacterium sp. KBS0706]
MIRIDKITIRKFRGIVELELEPKGENFAACGPNGTGKSGIVDAIEFALTGNLSRLSGRGTKELSVKQHGPHVDYVKKPEEAWVRLDVTLPSLGTKASITRTVKAATAPTIEPADAVVLAAFADVKLHPEFVLSRRELIRYIIAEPGDRSDEVQALLRLSDVEKLRGVLNKINNACAKDVAPAERAERTATQPLLDALGIEKLGNAAVLDAVNPKRTLLGLAPLHDLTATTDLADGLQAEGEGAVQKVPKAQAAADLATLRTALTTLGGEEVKARCAKISESTAALSGDADAANEVKRETLLKTALDLYDDEHCPVCDTPQTPDDFTAHLKGKLDHLTEVAQQRKALETEIAPLLDTVTAAGSAIRTILPYRAMFEPKLELKVLADYRVLLDGRYQQLNKLLPLEDTLAIVEAGFEIAPLGAELDLAEAAIKAVPEPNAEVGARTFLLNAQARLKAYREAKEAHQTAKANATLAARVYDIYGTSTTAALEAIYAKVEGTFSDLYREINKPDEGKFTAQLLPSLGKLGFNVDFYGRGQFPPGAFHSEGHQDGMGLCLYLALMSHLLGDNFTFAVLDDVLMSVDRGHRREVCALLKKRFPKSQFILTTHDEVWLRHMKAEGLIKGKSFAHFKNWSVDTGPAEWTNAGVWEEIDAHLSKGDVQPAAAALRHYLEYFAGEMCHRLRGTVEYRGDGNFGVGDLFTGASNALADAFKKAKASANSWNKQDLVTAIGERAAAFTAAREAAKVDQWQLNAGVHYNPWADLTREDFQHVVDAHKAFVAQFECANCSELLWVTPEYKPKEQLCCSCGDASLNLIPKPAGAKPAASPDAPKEEAVEPAAK